MTQRSRAATEVARGLWPHNSGSVATSDEVIAATGRICAQLRAGLGRWVGAQGYSVLLHRALLLARAEHPALNRFSCGGNDEQQIGAAVQAHGAPQVTAGTMAVVATLIDLLGRIIGQELAVALVKQVVAESRDTNTGTAGGLDG